MIQTVVCKCGREWQLWRVSLLHEETYSFDCTCGASLTDRRTQHLVCDMANRQKEIAVRSAS